MRFSASTSAYIRAPQRVVYSVLTSYRHFEAWVPDVNRSQLLAREGELAIAEFIVPPYGREKLVLELIESPRSSVVFTQVDRSREDGIFGRFQLETAEDGAGTKVEATFGANVSLFRLTCRRRLREVAERTMAGLADRALKLMVSGLGDVPDQRAKILEVEFDGDQATLRVGGTTYDLVRRKETSA